MLLKKTGNIANLKNNESSITVTDLGDFFSYLDFLTITIYSTTITLRPTHSGATTKITNE